MMTEMINQCIINMYQPKQNYLFETKNGNLNLNIFCVFFIAFEYDNDLEMQLGSIKLQATKLMCLVCRRNS